MRRFVVSLCCIFAMIVAFCATCQANSYGYPFSEEQAQKQAELENTYRQCVQYIQTVQTRQEIRTMLISRAEKYLESVRAEQGTILPTAFVVEGLLDFGLPATDSYIRFKAYQLSQMLSGDGQIYDEEGYLLHVETAYVHRILTLLGQGGNSKKEFAGDEIIHQTLGFLVADLPANAQEFLSENEFVLPDAVSQRVSVLGNVDLTSDELVVLANWDAVPEISVPGTLPITPQPEKPCSENVYVVSTTSSTGVKSVTESINNISSPTSNLFKPLNSSLQTQYNGFVLIAQTVVLRV